jgi:antirestriction protein ArdC
MSMSETDILDAENIDNKKNGKFDPYQAVTDKIINYFESGNFESLPTLWAGGGRPRNAHTGRTYNGINILLLKIRMDEEEWKHPLFLTFNQVKAINKLERFKNLVDENKYPAFVKKGSKGEQVCFWKRIKIKDNDGEEKTIPLLRLYTVFNIDQIEAKPEIREYLYRHAQTTATYENDKERNKSIDSFVKNVGISIRHHGKLAAYNWKTDKIKMPAIKSFISMDAYYATLLHEHVHATGHETRLDRDLKNRFGSDAYAFEELVAELGAAFLCADFSIFQDKWRHHAEYVRVWTNRMREDKHAIFRASSDAAKATTYLWEQQPNGRPNVDNDSSRKSTA